MSADQVAFVLLLLEALVLVSLLLDELVIVALLLDEELLFKLEDFNCAEVVAFEVLCCA
ncbi:hypothetical protein LGAA44_120004 [Leuconostoc gasicomitatum]|nr:hypothetical protein LGAA44_120004 [Leuconostoc gasicomitatum]